MKHLTYNSRRYKQALKKDEERLNRDGLRFLIDELHEQTFLQAVTAAEYILLHGSSNPKREIENIFETYQFIRLLRRDLTEPGNNLKLETDWAPTAHDNLTLADLVVALSPEAQKILKDKNIQL